MSEEVWCRLCFNTCNDYRNLYDESGHYIPELYEVIIKYFPPTILDMLDGHVLTVMCVECWRHISEFHNFQNNILLTQEQLNTTEVKPMHVNVEDEFPPLDILEHLTHGLDTAKKYIEVKCDNEDMSSRVSNLKEINKEQLLISKSEDSNDAVNNREVKCDNEKTMELTKEQHVISKTEDVNEIFSIDDNSQNEDSKQEMDTFNSENFDLCGSGSDSNAVELSSDDERSSTSRSELYSTTNRRISSRRKDVLIAKCFPTLNCPLCNTVCSTYTYLHQHFKCTHSGEKTYVQCCGRNINSRYLLAEHASLHIDPNKFKCKICGASYSSNTALRQHLIRRHPQSGVALSYAPRSVARNDAIIAQWKANLECALCGKSYPRLMQLHEHFKLKHPNEGFHILCCNRKFMLLTDIKEHALYHVAKNKRVQQKSKSSSLAGASNQSSEDDDDDNCEEMVTRRKIKAPSYYKCNMCRQTFRNFHRLQEHNETHAETDHLKCQHCSRGFKSSADLYTHLLKQHPDKEAVTTL